MTVADIDLGGKRTAEAETTLRRQLEPLLEEPVLVRHAGRRFRLPAMNVGLEVEIERILKDGLRESREGSMLTRTFRDVTGGSAKANLPARVSYSSSSLAAFVREVKKSVDRPTRNATVRPEGAGLRRMASRAGFSVQSRRLTRMIAAALAHPSARAVEVPVRIKKPRVTTRELADRYATSSRSIEARSGSAFSGG